MPVQKVNEIFYKNRRHYKYTLVNDYVVQVDVYPEQGIKTDYASLSVSGELEIKAGYSWDGGSGPAVDTNNFMRATVVHDCLYQFLRESLLPLWMRELCDLVMRKMCREDGMSEIRAWWIYRGVRSGGGNAAKPGILSAP